MLDWTSLRLNNWTVRNQIEQLNFIYIQNSTANREDIFNCIANQGNNSHKNKIQQKPQQIDNNMPSTSKKYTNQELAARRNHFINKNQDNSSHAKQKLQQTDNNTKSTSKKYSDQELSARKNHITNKNIQIPPITPEPTAPFDNSNLNSTSLSDITNNNEPLPKKFKSKFNNTDDEINENPYNLFKNCEIHHLTFNYCSHSKDNKNESK